MTEYFDICIKVALLSLVLVRAKGLQCYLCNGYYSSSSCTTTIDCTVTGYCYKKTADRIVGGTTNRVTIGGCMFQAGCTDSGRKALCNGETNCIATCCNTDYCNPATQSPNNHNTQLYPKCYSCESEWSYADCRSRSILKTCSSTPGQTAYCYTADNLEKRNGIKRRVYRKDCITLNRDKPCSWHHDNCNAIKDGSCNLQCCYGNGCNAGLAKRVSSLAFLSCAIIYTVFLLI